MSPQVRADLVKAKKGVFLAVLRGQEEGQLYRSQCGERTPCLGGAGPPPWEPCPGAACVCAFSALSVRRVGTTLRSSPIPALWATAWSPLRTQCSDAARSFSRRQPTRHERDFQRPPPRPKESPWPGFWVGCQGPSSGPGHLPHITCCKAHLDGTRVCVDAHPAVSSWGAGFVVLHLHGADYSCCLY